MIHPLQLTQAALEALSAGNHNDASKCLLSALKVLKKAADIERYRNCFKGALNESGGSDEQSELLLFISRVVGVTNEALGYLTRENTHRAISSLKSIVGLYEGHQQATHYRAVLDEHQAGNQPDLSKHIVLFKNPLSAQIFIDEESESRGWRYSLEELHVQAAA